MLAGCLLALLVARADVADFIGDDIVQTQIERQYRDLNYSGKITPDFAPFAAQLDALDAAWLARVEALVADATVPQIAAHFASGALSSVDLTLYYLHRIRALDVDRYNSVLRVNPSALEMAARADAERETADAALNVMHGIPVLLKDNIGTGDDMPTSAGALALADSYAGRDAFIVARLREAGAVILGKNNLSEWANFMTFASANGFSVLGGQTRNAYGRFDVGGSSSGSAVSVALNLAMVSVGTETSGSLTYPASQNSVATFKPSIGLVSRDHIIPISSAQDSAGPMARNMTDLAHLLDVLAADDPDDPASSDVAPLFDVRFADVLDADALRGVRVAMVAYDEPYRDGDDAIRQDVIERLRMAGAEVVEIAPLPYPVDMFRVLFYGFHSGVNDYLRAVDAPQRTLADVVAFNAADATNRAPHGQSILEASLQFEINPTMAAHYAENVAHNRAVTRDIIGAALADNDARLLIDLSNYSTAVYASAGTPALNIPAGYRADGEPLGVTLMGDWLDDAFLISAGYALEQVASVRRPPPLD